MCFFVLSDNPAGRCERAPARLFPLYLFVSFSSIFIWTMCCPYSILNPPPLPIPPSSDPSTLPHLSLSFHLARSLGSESHPFRVSPFKGAPICICTSNAPLCPPPAGLAANENETRAGGQKNFERIGKGKKINKRDYAIPNATPSRIRVLSSVLRTLRVFFFFPLVFLYLLLNPPLEPPPPSPPPPSTPYPPPRSSSVPTELTLAFFLSFFLSRVTKHVCPFFVRCFSLSASYSQLCATSRDDEPDSGTR